MVINGKRLADGLIGQLKKEFKKLPRLTVGAVLVVPRSPRATGIPAAKSGLGSKNPASMSFLKQKSKAAETIGISFKVFKFSQKIKTEKLKKEISKLNNSKNIDGIIVQLPMPAHINTGKILGAVSSSKDIDALSPAPRILAPTVEAVKFIFEKYKINYKNKNILIIGRGRLVGKPIFRWLKKENKSVKIIDPVREKSLQAAEAVHLRWTAFSNGVDERQKDRLQEFTGNANIIISGAGKGGLIKGPMVKKGAILIDFGFDPVRNRARACPVRGRGTLRALAAPNGACAPEGPVGRAISNGVDKSSGRIAGDFDFESCAKKAKLITPVPGGMGPIMVAMLFRNLMTLALRVEK